MLDIQCTQGQLSTLDTIYNTLRTEIGKPIKNKCVSGKLRFSGRGKWELRKLMLCKL
jgi:hypothetical protein